MQEYYDLDKQLFRVDFDARGTQPPLLGTGPSVDIRDMKTGKSTRYNRGTGEAYKGCVLFVVVSVVIFSSFVLFVCLFVLKASFHMIATLVFI